MHLLSRNKDKKSPIIKTDNKNIGLTFIRLETGTKKRAATKNKMAEKPERNRQYFLQKTQLDIFMKSTRNYLQQCDLWLHARLIQPTLPHSTCH
jgi:hypothetical protein